MAQINITICRETGYITKWKRFLHIFTTIVIASAVLSLFNSSLIELSDEKDNVRFCASTIGSISSCKKLSKSSDVILGSSEIYKSLEYAPSYEVKPKAK